jgi:hypothetical protein
MSNEQLRELFRSVPLESLPSGFVENLMSRIERKAARQKKMKIVISFLLVAAGIVCMLTLPLLAIYLCKLFIPELSFSFFDVNIDVNSNSAIIGFAVLLLLVIDCLYRKLSHKS